MLTRKINYTVSRDNEEMLRSYLIPIIVLAGRDFLQDLTMDQPFWKEFQPNKFAYNSSSSGEEIWYQTSFPCLIRLNDRLMLEWRKKAVQRFENIDYTQWNTKRGVKEFYSHTKRLQQESRFLAQSILPKKTRNCSTKKKWHTLEFCWKNIQTLLTICPTTGSSIGIDYCDRLQILAMNVLLKKKPV